ncbi:MAG: hypothetical protein KDA29_10280 [Phycisphaerales bacterium]|nr:hypothetical protein [Phycisphaerales bacterium]
MIWSFLLWVLLVLGLVVGVRAWLWDRAGFRGRAKRRCRRCWYDLTGAVERDDGYVCPECGKRHRTIRSMRKTRRSWRLVVVAVVMFLSAYAIGIRGRYNNQQFRQLGWPVLVPTPVLILTMPLMPDEAGSLPDRNSGTSSLPYKQRPLGERIAREIDVRLYKSESTTLLDRWLFERMARRESWATLSDETSVRGQVYTYVYRALARQHRLGPDEEHWARSVYWMDVEAPVALPQMSPVYVRVKEFRRLLNEGFWRVQIGKSLFELRRRSPNFEQILVHVGGDNPYHNNYARIAEYVRWPNMLSSVNYEDLPIRGRIYEGDPDVDVWWPVGVIEDSVRVKILSVGQASGQNSIGPIEGIEEVDDQETLDWIKKAVEIRFVWERRFPMEGDVPIGIRVSFDRDRLRTDIPGFTFGGSIYLHCKIKGPQASLSGSYGYQMLMSEPSWWALRDDRDQDGRRVVDGAGSIAFNGGRSELLKGAWGYSNADGIGEAWFEILPYGNTVGEGNFAPLWDLDAQRICAKPIKVPLSEHQIRMLEGACRTMLERQGIHP